MEMTRVQKIKASSRLFDKALKKGKASRSLLIFGPRGKSSTGLIFLLRDGYGGDRSNGRKRVAWKRHKHNASE